MKRSTDVEENVKKAKKQKKGKSGKITFSSLHNAPNFFKHFRNNSKVE